MKRFEERLSSDDLWAIRQFFPARIPRDIRCDRFSENTGKRCHRWPLHRGRCDFRERPLWFHGRAVA